MEIFIKRTSLLLSTFGIGFCLLLYVNTQTPDFLGVSEKIVKLFFIVALMLICVVVFNILGNKFSIGKRKTKSTSISVALTLAAIFLCSCWLIFIVFIDEKGPWLERPLPNMGNGYEWDFVINKSFAISGLLLMISTWLLITVNLWHKNQTRVLSWIGILFYLAFTILYIVASQIPKPNQNYSQQHLNCIKTQFKYCCKSNKNGKN